MTNLGDPVLDLAAFLTRLGRGDIARALLRRHEGLGALDAGERRSTGLEIAEEIAISDGGLSKTGTTHPVVAPEGGYPTKD